MVSEDHEETAKRIAERGREALLTRLRPAFREAAKAHSDLLSLDEEQLEEMVQRAADRADGLQWRRALASVATEELGIGLGEALGHPAVERAQVLVGAPSYEESLAKLTESSPAQAGAGAGAGPTTASTPETARADAADERLEEEEEVAAAAPVEATSDASDEHGSPEPSEAAGPAEEGAEGAAEAEVAEPEDEDAAEAAKDGVARATGGDAVEDETAGATADEATEDATAGARAESGEPPGEGPETLRLSATHLGGIASLGTPEQGLELRLGDFGLDIARRPGIVIGRLRWQEINDLEVTTPKGLRRRRRSGDPQLVIRTQHGDATFEVPAVSEEELNTHLQPLLIRYAQR